jgi:hypothetical protein
MKLLSHTLRNPGETGAARWVGTDGGNIVDDFFRDITFLLLFYIL